MRIGACWCGIWRIIRTNFLFEMGGLAGRNLLFHMAVWQELTWLNYRRTIVIWVLDCGNDGHGILLASSFLFWFVSPGLAQWMAAFLSV